MHLIATCMYAACMCYCLFNVHLHAWQILCNNIKVPANNLAMEAASTSRCGTWVHVVLCVYSITTCSAACSMHERACAMHLIATCMYAACMCYCLFNVHLHAWQILCNNIKVPANNLATEAASTSGSGTWVHVVLCVYSITTCSVHVLCTQ